jgi:hypothetical protein
VNSKASGPGASAQLAPKPSNGPDRILLHETGGISAAAPSPSRFRGQRHTFQSTASCIPNTSDETGMPTAGTGTPTAYRYAEWLVSGSAFFNHPSQSPFERRETGIERRAPGVKHDIPLRSEFRAMQSKYRAQTPLNTIANHGSADRPRDRKSEPWTLYARPKDARPRDA